MGCGAQVRRESYRRREYAREDGPRGGALQNLDLYPCRDGPAIEDCPTGRTGVFSYLPPGYDADADRAIYAAFAEAALPLSHGWDAQLALRYEDYGSQGGSSLDPKAALRWQALPSLALRLSAGTTFRAPTLNQTQDGIADTSRQFVGRIGTFKPIRALGNRDLDPEQATTVNAGLIFDREGLFAAADRLFVSADFWHYAFRKPLVLEPYVRVLNLACPVGEALCDRASPYFGRLDFGGQDAVSDIAAVSVSVVNGPDIDTDGLDFKAEYSLFTPSGEWTLGAAGTRTLSWRIKAWRFGPAYEALGRLNYDTPLARTVLKRKGRAYLNWQTERFNLRYTLRYADDYRHDLDSEPRIRAQATHDLTAAVTLFDGRLTLDAAVLNLTDRDPPWVLRQINYDPVTHNPMGRMVQAGVRWRL